MRLVTKMLRWLHIEPAEDQTETVQRRMRESIHGSRNETMRAQATAPRDKAVAERQRDVADEAIRKMEEANRRRE